jgi:hypothetical protein
MYPKQLIQEQVDRLFNKLKQIDSDILAEKEKGFTIENFSEKTKYQLMQFFTITSKILPRFEDAIDDLKTALDSMDIDEQELEL